MPPKEPAASKAAGKARASTTAAAKAEPRKAASSKRGPKPHVECTPEIVDRICEEIAIGRALIEICRSEDWAPAERVFHRWRVNDDEIHQKYTRAKESQQHSRLDAIYAEIDACPAEGAEVQKLRLKVDTMKWEASKLAPKTFGDKQTIDLNVSDADKDDRELLHELRQVSEQLGLAPDAVLAGLSRPH